MNNSRDPHLQRLLDLSASVIRAASSAPVAKAAARIFSRLEERVGEPLAPPAERLGPCRQLAAIYARMARQATPLPQLANAFAALEPRLQWNRRKGAKPEDRNFYNGHANAMLVGPGGLEQRDDVWVGATVLAPDVRYIDHSHPPEEVYLAFTAGEWWNAAMDWTQPGAGGLIYNPPGILHAMRSGPQPMLALWLLPVD